MNSITVTVNLSEEDRARLDKIIEALTPQDLDSVIRARLDEIFKALKPQAPTPVIRKPIDIPEDKDAAQPTEPETPEPVEAPQPEPDTEPAPQPEQPEPEQPEQPAPAAPQHTRAELQHLVVTLTSAGKKAEVRAIVLAVAPKVSDIPEDKIDEVFKQLKALEG